MKPLPRFEDFTKSTCEVVVTDTTKGVTFYDPVECYRIGAMAIHLLYEPTDRKREYWPVCHAATGIEIIRCKDLQSAIWLAHVADNAVDWSKVRRGETPLTPIGFTPALKKKLEKAIAKNSYSIPLRTN